MDPQDRLGGCTRIGGRGVVAQTRRKFDAEFRAGAVRIVTETGKPIAQVARVWGLRTALWVTGWPRTGPPGRATVPVR